MVDSDGDVLDRTFQALANPTRRKLIGRLAQGPASVGDLAQPFEMSLSGVSKHLHYLEAAGLIVRTIIGRQTLCELTPAGLERAHRLLDEYREFWANRLDSLESFMREGR